MFAATVRKEFAFLKGTRALADLHARSIVLPGERGLLVPVCELHGDDAQLISTLSRWREANASAFPTCFPVTDAGTARWLRGGLLDVEDRLLFLVCDRHGHAVGHLGFANALDGDRALEVDNVVRGEPGEPGLMAAALDALLRWAAEVLGPQADRPARVRGQRPRRRVLRAAGLPRRRCHRPAPRGARRGATAFVPAAPGERVDRRFLVMEHAPAVPAPAQILTAGPSMSAREASYALDAVRHGWNDRHSGYLDRVRARRSPTTSGSATRCRPRAARARCTSRCWPWASARATRSSCPT